MPLIFSIRCTESFYFHKDNNGYITWKRHLQDNSFVPPTEILKCWLMEQVQISSQDFNLWFSSLKAKSAASWAAPATRKRLNKKLPSWCYIMHSVQQAPYWEATVLLAEHAESKHWVHPKKCFMWTCSIFNIHCLLFFEQREGAKINQCGSGCPGNSKICLFFSTEVIH